MPRHESESNWMSMMSTKKSYTWTCKRKFSIGFDDTLKFDFPLHNFTNRIDRTQHYLPKDKVIHV